jgi:hypothetical protein
VTNSKNLVGNFEVSVTNQTRRAQPPMHLRRFENLSMQLSVVPLKGGELSLQLRAMQFV